jgi:RNA polymerase sigma-70 factor (ECF subfamily)
MIGLLRGDMAGLSDYLLVERVKERDDPRAFDEIVRRHKNRIFSYVCRMTHDAPDAEDLTQEVFLRAYQSIQRFRADSAIDTWLYRIATNLVIDRSRRVKRTPPTWEPLPDEEEDALAAIPDPDRGRDPAATVQLGELQQQVRRAVGSLPPKLRGAVVLHDIEGLSCEEAAEALGCPVGTVKSRLFNGRNLLRRKLAHYVEGD